MRSTRFGLALGLATLALVVAGPSAASAAERFAAPSGSGSSCGQAAPCSLSQAFAGSSSGDEIILAGGDYGSPTQRLTDQYYDEWKALDVHGVAGAVPKIWSSNDGGVFALVSPGSRLSYVDVDHAPGPEQGGPAVWGNMVSVDHVRINSTGSGMSYSNSTAATFTLSNTSIHATAGGGWGLNLMNARGLPDSAAEFVMRNVTIVSDGATSPALTVSSIGVSGAKVATTTRVSNSILRGTGSDVDAYASGPGDSTEIVLDHSNFETPRLSGQGARSITSAGEDGNQSAAPLFVNRASGNLRQASGSPTIDAGAADPLAGDTDAYGGARVVGSTIDIGAHEFVPPPADPNGGNGDGSGNGGNGDGSGNGGSGAGAGSGAGDGSGPGTAAGGSNGGGSGSGNESGSGGKPVAVRCIVPKLKGKTLKQAKTALKKAGCAVGTVRSKRSRANAGRILSQGKKPRARLRRGAKIALVVGRR